MRNDRLNRLRENSALGGIGAIWVVQNHHPPPISHPEPTVPDLFWTRITQMIFSAASEACPNYFFFVLGFGFDVGAGDDFPGAMR